MVLFLAGSYLRFPWIGFIFLFAIHYYIFNNSQLGLPTKCLLNDFAPSQELQEIHQNSLGCWDLKN